MKAMILAAGLGKRLRPLTDIRPKALMPVNNRPVIARNIDYLKIHGVNSMVVNAHHHYRQIVDYLEGGRPFGVDIEVRVEPEILGTGGGLRNCSDLLEREAFILINSDIMTDIGLEKVLEYHKKTGSRATLILHDREPFNQIRVDEQHRIIDIARQNDRGRLAFTGIHIIEPDIFSYIPGPGYSDIIDCYRKMIDSGITVNAYVSRAHYWRDIGNPKSYMSANREILAMENRSSSVGQDSHIAPSASIKEWAVIGEKAYVEEDVEIRRSVLWDNVRVRRNVKITDSIVTGIKEVENNLNNEIH